ncbi:MAG: L-threonylcarbamoyladenylate synthase [Fibrobacterota bacterium]
MNLAELRIKHAAECLKAGGVVAFPTETVYGLGADAFNPQAVAAVFELKNRPFFDPLIVHIASLEQMDALVKAIPPKAQKLIAKFWPGPLTIILPKRDKVPDIVTAGLRGVGIRMPAHPVALELIRMAGTPVAAPSANKFGKLSPTCARHVADEFGTRDFEIIDGGPCRVGVESTIISFMNEAPVLLRPGGIAVEEIEQAIGPVIIPAPGECAMMSPGRAERHYSPRTRIILDSSIERMPKHYSVGLLTFIPIEDMIKYDAVEVLSRTGAFREAAANLFSALRHLDAAHLDVIIANRLPETGLGRTINDRLTRMSVENEKQTKVRDVYDLNDLDKTWQT